MSGGRTRLIEGERVLTEKGYGVPVKIAGAGWQIRNAWGELAWVDWPGIKMVRELSNGEAVPVAEALRPVWDAIDDGAKRIVLDRLEVVQEILTGYRDGLPELARDGEPHPPFGSGSGVSETRRCEKMAELLVEEMQWDRGLQRRFQAGELQAKPISVSTIRNWVRAFKADGVVALIDGRSLRTRLLWERIDPRFRAVADEVLETLDGDISTVAIAELRRRIDVRLKDDRIQDLKVPERISAQYLSALKRQRGSTTRAQRSRSLRKTSGTQHFPALRPGQVIAIDATRADNLVWSPLSGKAYSVEILTAIDVATRVVVALRVVPRSASGIDAGLLLYDVCRPFSMEVRGTAISDWRWVGLPEQLDLSQTPARIEGHSLTPDFSTLQGFHRIPSVRFDAVHADQGAIFVSWLFRAILQSLGIDLLLSRGAHPTDNPHVERWHETIQRLLQQLSGYKGRNVSERGRLVAEEPLVTAWELQDHLRRGVALDYHRSPHDGLILPGEETARMCPLEMWDAMVESTGRIDVPQRADLIYQFLPVKRLTVSHQGVEWRNLIYDSKVLDDIRSRPASDRVAAFFVDPHDVSRIWFRDPDTRVVKLIPWRGIDRTDAPMTAAIRNAACRRIRDRGGNSVLNRKLSTRQILDELTELTRATKLTGDWGPLVAAELRVEQSRLDHGEAQRAIQQREQSSSARDEAGQVLIPEPSTTDTRWPDLITEA